jgi:acyl-CoA reductase-like NAD-dependent aldehyde dehydrogenase
VQAARRAFDSGPWSAIHAAKPRAGSLQAGRKVREHLPALAEMETRNTGKPIVEGEGDIAAVAEVFEYYAAWPPRSPAWSIPSPPMP